jgi:hypothetical protein
VADFLDRLWGGRDGGSSAGLPGTSHHWEPTAGIEAHESESPFAHDKLDRLVDTRRCLHAIAELLLAGPQHRASGTIRLAVTPTGFRTTAAPDIALDGSELVLADQRVLLLGSFAHIGDSCGLTAAAPFDVYSEGPDSDPRKSIHLDDDSRHVIVAALNAGDAALREFAPDLTPVLWPEHFDVSVVFGEVTYGVSAGDDTIPVPYAYVAPFSPRTGEFWNQPFGAAQPVKDLVGVAAITAFFRAGAAAAAG